MLIRHSRSVRALVGALGLYATHALAVDEADGASAAPASGLRSTESGAFMPWGFAARNDTQHAYAALSGGYDTGRGGLLLDLSVQARVLGPLSLRGGASYVGPGGEARPHVSLAVDLAHQEALGVNLALYGGYQAQGFNTVPALHFTLAASRTLGRFNLMANLGYGYGLEDGEHYGEARVAMLARVLPALHVGVDARGRVDLERDGDEPEGEPDFEVFAAPVVNLSVDRFVVGVAAGLSLVKFRASDDVQTGALARLTLGSAF